MTQYQKVQIKYVKLINTFIIQQLYGWFFAKHETKLCPWQILMLVATQRCSFTPLIVILSILFLSCALSMLWTCEACTPYTHTLTHTEAIPEWRTECTRGVIYYTVLTIPRTITASLSNRLKMASESVHTNTVRHMKLIVRVWRSDSSSLGRAQEIT